MLRDMYGLAVRYFSEHRLRDLLFLLAFASVVFLLYLVNIDVGSPARPGRLAVQVANLRYGVVMFWVAAAAVYTLYTAFGGYGDGRRCYATLLLPASSRAKYAWEWFRTLVLFPLAAFGAACAVDALYIGYLVRERPAFTGIFDDFDTLLDNAVAAGEPLNYIPCMLYALVWFHCVMMLARSGMGRVSAVVLAVAALFVWQTFPSVGGRGMLYPFVSVELVREYAVRWSMQVSWCSRMTGYAISYLWYAALPAAVYVLSYLKFKEREI